MMDDFHQISAVGEAPGRKLLFDVRVHVVSVASMDQDIVEVAALLAAAGEGVICGVEFSIGRELT